MVEIKYPNFQSHPFHLVSPSPWPIFCSITLIGLTTSGVSTMHSFYSAKYFALYALICLIYSMSLWFRDITAEATYLGNHTGAVKKGINIGVGLFILSEALFFMAIFWTFLHSALSPTAEMGMSWPPRGVEYIDAFELPLINTFLLLASGISVTYSHHSFIKGLRERSLYSLFVTIVLAVVFTVLQGVEYVTSSFNFSDASYGSCFYFATGFHGLHVIIGTAFLAVALWRMLAYHFTRDHHVGFESGILYWHFVDIVWLFLFISVYYWGSL